MANGVDMANKINARTRNIKSDAAFQLIISHSTNRVYNFHDCHSFHGCQHSRSSIRYIVSFLSPNVLFYSFSRNVQIQIDKTTKDDSQTLFKWRKDFEWNEISVNGGTCTGRYFVIMAMPCNLKSCSFIESECTARERGRLPLMWVEAEANSVEFWVLLMTQVMM